MRKVDEKAFLDFAQNKVYWYGKTRSNVDVSSVLQTILDKKPAFIEAEAREKFGFTDEDFREALKLTPPGLFWGVGAEQKWVKINIRLGITPPLPFPVMDLDREWAELRQLRGERHVSLI